MVFCQNFIILEAENIIILLINGFKSTLWLLWRALWQIIRPEAYIGTISAGAAGISRDAILNAIFIRYREAQQAIR